MTRLISRAELARLGKVSGSAVTKACKHQLAPACVGRRIDLDHAAAQNYLRGKDAAPSTERQTGKVSPAAPTPTPPAAQSATSARGAQRARAAKPGGLTLVTHQVENIDSIADLTIREVVKTFGTVQAFKDWLVTLKQIEDIRERRLRNEETDGTLIPREPVQTHVFGVIDEAFRRLLTDTPKTIARRMYALAKSGVAIEQAERTTREIISSQLEPMKTQAARVLRNV